MKALRRKQFGDPILRQKAKELSLKDITSPTIQELIADMQHTLLQRKLGIGLAAPQVGRSLALAVIAIRSSEYRPDIPPFNMVVINPKIIKQMGPRISRWEGCISSGSGKAALFAQVPRYPEIRVRYHDEHGERHTQTFKGLRAQVLQHEIDHLEGVLFVDRVEDTSTYMTSPEYIKMAKQQRRQYDQTTKK